MPIEYREITRELVSDIVFTASGETRFWYRREDTQVMALLYEMYSVNLCYSSREMSIEKNEFALWEIPVLPDKYTICGYDEKLHMKYLCFMEESMSNVIVPGTHPLLDIADDLRSFYTDIDRLDHFHVLWDKDEIVGISFTNGRELDTLAMSEMRRREGLGYYLLYRGLASAFQDSDASIHLYVIDSNTNAYEFYRHHGMHCTGYSTQIVVR